MGNSSTWVRSITVEDKRSRLPAEVWIHATDLINVCRKAGLNNLADEIEDLRDEQLTKK